MLEASAGTGKTTVLVQRYVNLLSVGVDPANILAITFTRKAAAEMRERIIAMLRRAAAESDAGRTRWLALRDRVGDIAISTIDAFCYALLREFPLEAGLAPGFTVADETESARLAEDAIDRAMARCRRHRRLGSGGGAGAHPDHAAAAARGAGAPGRPPPRRAVGPAPLHRPRGRARRRRR